MATSETAAPGHTPGGPRWVPENYRAVLRDRTFALLLPGFAISALGTGMSAIAIAWLGLQIAPAGWQGVVVGAGYAAYELPAVVGGLGLTRWLGHWSGRALLGADCVLRGAFLGVLASLAITDRLEPVTYVVLLAGSSLLRSWGKAGTTKLVAELLPADARLAGNAVVATLTWLTMIAGPGLAGVFAATLGPGVAVAVDGASFLLLALNLLIVGPGHARAATASAARSPLTSLSGVRHLGRAAGVPSLLVLTATVAFLFGPFEVALPVYVAQWPDGGPGALGVMWSLFGVGAVVGGLAAEAVRSVPILRAAVGIAVIWGCALVTVGTSQSVLVSAVALLVGGLAYAPYPPLVATHLQNTIPPAQLAAAAAAWGSVITLAAPAGYLFGGLVVAPFGAQATVLGAGVATIAVAAGAAAVRRMVRRPRPERLGDPEAEVVALGVGHDGEGAGARADQGRLLDEGAAQRLRPVDRVG
jgi:hypothetical protein